MHTTRISHRHYVIFYMGGPKEQIMYYNLRNGLLCSLSLSTKLLYVYEKQSGTLRKSVGTTVTLLWLKLS